MKRLLIFLVLGLSFLITKAQLFPEGEPHSNLIIFSDTLNNYVITSDGDTLFWRFKDDRSGVFEFYNKDTSIAFKSVGIFEDSVKIDKTLTVGSRTGSIGANSVVFGSEGNEASGENSFAFGGEKYSNTASGYASTAFGDTTIASGNHSTAWGSYSTASGVNSTALGSNTTASGLYSTASGYHSTASGNYSTAWGVNTTASGIYSTAWGDSCIANQDNQTAFGYYNDTTNTDALLMIGNGSAGNRSNAVTIEDGGNIGIGITDPSYKLDVDGAINANDSIIAGTKYKINRGIGGRQVIYIPDLMHVDNMIYGTGGTLLQDPASSNTFVGARAGDSVTTATDNTLIGDNAGINLETGYSNIFLGSGAGYNETGSNKLYIENSLANKYNALLYGEFDNEFLRINDHLSIDTTKGLALFVNGAGHFTDSIYGETSMTVGSRTGSVGANSLVVGSGNKANNLFTVALGNNTIASGAKSFSSGNGTKASGSFSVTFGYRTMARSTYSIAGGDSCIANKTHQTAFGKYNDTTNTDALFMIGNGSAGNRSNAVTIEDGGNIGIGITDPSYKLDVNGTARIADTLFISDDTSGVYLQASERSLFYENSGNSIMIGDEALSSDGFSDNRNIGIGYQAGTNISTGSDNVCIGYQSGDEIASEGSNIYIGNYIGFVSQTGGGNVGIGERCIQKAGYNNTALGHSAGRNNSAESYNVFVGSKAGQGDGYWNGDNNVIIGQMAASEITSGFNNVILGSVAGYNTAGDNNIFIGYRAGYNETGSNLLYIENSNSASPLIYGDFAADSLTINGDVNIKEALILNVTTVNVATYDLLTSDNIIHVTYTSTAAVTSLTLPAAQVIEGRTLIIKDAGGNANTNNITIDTEGAATIDGAATYVINSDYGDVEFYSDGSNWFIY